MEIRIGTGRPRKKLDELNEELDVDEGGYIGILEGDLHVCAMTGELGLCAEDPTDCVGSWEPNSDSFYHYVCLGGGVSLWLQKARVEVLDE